MTRSRLALLLLSQGLLLCSGCSGSHEREVDAPYLTFEPIALENEPAQVTGFKFIPGTSELLVITRDGFVHHYVLEEDTTTLLGSFRAPDVYVDLDCGLVSLAFDPDFDDNRFLYLGQCFSLTHSGIVRLELDTSDYGSIAGTAVEIARYGDDAANRPWHNVGQMEFDSEGNLWALVGDKALGEDVDGPDDPLGTVVRIRPSREPGVGGHEPAPGNPHETDPRFHPDVYAYGLRSPWTGTRDRFGRMLIGDVGQDSFEEINLLSEPGQDFGWPRHEGPCRSGCDGVTDPIIHWDRSDDHPYIEDDPYADQPWSRVVWIGPEYHPPAPDLDPYEGELTGRFLFGELCVGFTRLLEVHESGQVMMDAPVGHISGATGWDIGPDGHLYAVSFGRCTTSASARYPTAGLFRAVLSERPDDSEPSEGQFPEDLGAFYPQAPNLSVVPAGGEAYEPRWPLWSNGLGKLRHILLPEGEEPSRAGDDAYDFPDGTMFFKTFKAGEHPIETRVMRLVDGEWQFAAYRWNEDATSATLLDGRAPVPVEVTVDGETFEHRIPSRAQCRSCHEAGERRVLGYTPVQLDDEADIEAPDSLTREVMGYVYGNCVQCHDGSGEPQASFSLLPEDFLANTINQPTQGSASGAGIRVVPEDPDESVLYQAVRGGDSERGVQAMPPLGVQRRDPSAEQLLHQWITELDDD